MTTTNTTVIPELLDQLLANYTKSEDDPCCSDAVHACPFAAQSIRFPCGPGIQSYGGDHTPLPDAGCRDHPAAPRRAKFRPRCQCLQPGQVLGTTDGLGFSPDHKG
jgi:hypothetical protein